MLAKFPHKFVVDSAWVFWSGAEFVPVCVVRMYEVIDKVVEDYEHCIVHTHSIQVQTSNTCHVHRYFMIKFVHLSYKIGTQLYNG